MEKKMKNKEKNNGHLWLLLLLLTIILISAISSVEAQRGKGYTQEEQKSVLKLSGSDDLYCSSKHNGDYILRAGEYTYIDTENYEYIKIVSKKTDLVYSLDLCSLTK